MAADIPPGRTGNGHDSDSAGSIAPTQTPPASRLQEWKVTLDEATGLVIKLEKLSDDGASAELSYEGTEAMALVYGVPPEVAEAALAGQPLPVGSLMGIGPATLAAWQHYASIPLMFSYWQGYADALAQGASSPG